MVDIVENLVTEYLCGEFIFVYAFHLLSFSFPALSSSFSDSHSSGGSVSVCGIVLSKGRWKPVAIPINSK